MNKKVINRFYYIKKLINSTNDTKTLIDGQFYYTTQAFNYVNKINKRYFMNKYYDLTTLDYLLMVDVNKNIYDLQSNLYKEYDSDYANALWCAFTETLERELNYE